MKRIILASVLSLATLPALAALKAGDSARNSMRKPRWQARPSNIRYVMH